MIVCKGRQHDFDSEEEGLYLSFYLSFLHPFGFEKLVDIDSPHKVPIKNQDYND